MVGKRKQSGFTLIELMIVVVIIGILAAVAIPQFLRYQLKSKTSEAPRNMAAIRMCEETFAGKFASYALSQPNGGGGANKVTWNSAANDGFSTIGFTISGSVYYLYSVAQSPPVTATGVVTPGANTTVDASGMLLNGVAAISGQPDIWIQASANLDGAGDHGSFYATDEGGAMVPVPGTAGESTF